MNIVTDLILLSLPAAAEGVTQLLTLCSHHRCKLCLLCITCGGIVTCGNRLPSVGSCFWWRGVFDSCYIKCNSFHKEKLRSGCQGLFFFITSVKKCLRGVQHWASRRCRSRWTAEGVRWCFEVQTAVFGWSHIRLHSVCVLMESYAAPYAEEWDIYDQVTVFQDTDAKQCLLLSAEHAHSSETLSCLLFLICFCDLLFDQQSNTNIRVSYLSFTT